MMDWLSRVFSSIFTYIKIYIYIIHICMKWNEMKSLSRVRLFAIPWTVAHQAPWSMGFSRHEYWSGFIYIHIHICIFTYKHIHYTHTHTHTHTLVMFLWRALIQPQSRVYILITTPRIFSWYPWEKMTRVQIRIFQAGWNTLLKEYQLENLCQCRRKSLGHASGLLTWCCPIQHFCQWLMM